MVIVRLVGEWDRSGKGVVRFADEVGVAEGFAAELGGQLNCKVAKLAKRLANVDRRIAIFRGRLDLV